MKSNLVLKRITAYLIDFLVITIISSALTYISFINPKYDEYIKVSEEYTSYVNDYYDKKIDSTELVKKTQALNYPMTKAGYIYVISDIAIAILYFGVFAFVTKGQTLGKKLMGIKIVSNKDKELKIYNYLIRAFILNGLIMNIITLIALCFKESTFLQIYSMGANIDTVLLILNFLMICFYKDGRGLHDILAGTKVINVNYPAVIEEPKKEVEVIKPQKKKSVKKDNK